MKRVFIFLFLILCAFLSVKIMQSNAVAKSTVAPMIAEQNAPSPYPTLTPTFAVNYAIQTKDAAEAEAAVQAVTIVAGVATETASIGRTREAIALQIQSDGATSTAVVHETQYAPTAQAIMLAAQMDREQAAQQKSTDEGFAVAQVFWWLFSRIVGFIVTVVAIWKGLQWIGKQADMVGAEPAKTAELKDSKQKVALNKIEIKQGSSLNYYKLPCTDEQVLFIANGVVNQGRGLSYARWTPEANGFSRGDWKAIVDVLLSAGMAVYKNGANDENGYRVTPAGWGYFQKIAGRTTTPPLPQTDTTE